MTIPNQEVEQFSFFDLLPVEWTASEDATVWVTGFRIFMAPQAVFSTGIKTADIFGARIFAFIGKFPYVDPGATSFRNWNGVGPLQLDHVAVHEQQFEGALLIVVAPAETPSTESAIRKRVGAVEGAVRALFGHNAAYDRAFEYRLSKGGGYQVATAGLRHPGSFPVPNFGDDAFVRLRAMSEFLEHSTDVENRRMALALQWFNEGCDRWGVDAFLRFCVAFEVLEMADTTNIAPVNRALAGAYGITPREAGQRFHFGRLWRLRGAILHNGHQPPISAGLEDYVRGMFVDVAHTHTGLACAGEAARTLSEEVEQQLLAMTMGL